MSKELDVEEITRIAENIGRAVHRRYPQTPAEDLSQEVWLWVAEHADEILEWNPERTESLQDTTGSTARLYLRGYRVATAYARRQKAVVGGYEPRDEFFYSIGMLRRILPLYFEERLAGNPDALVVPDRDAVMDLQVALGQVAPEEAWLLRVMFEGDHDARSTYDHIADRLRITPQAAEKKVQRALGALQEALGGRNPYDRHQGRKAISNARAAAITAQQLEA